MAEIQDQVDSVEERSERAYQEAKQTVLSGSKETSKEGKEVPKESQETPMGNTPMTVQPGNTAKRENQEEYKHKANRDGNTNRQERCSGHSR